ncbi:TPA: replication protein, partial [Mannheimia haemolytica]|nr:replication protein [Mannheimia haemolytica]HDL5625958.1 replication protein [Mannheimia haemolytica]HDL5853687.1 replication protein [Mannheimia haemolytica]HDZ3664618.1 replication protein [Mannheimia haemolytica]
MSLQKTEQNRPLAVLGEQQGKLSSEIENLVDRIFDQLLA